jgi:Phytanoyl-CoA dioxygenase (PhyH)
MESVYVIKDAITSMELLKLSDECNYYRNAIGNSDLSELGSAIDIFEDFNLSETHGARRDPDSYFAERWRKKHTIDEDKAIVKSFLLVKLPSIISTVFACHKLHIFNEVYIVKEPHSQVAFRWHTDSEEQLCALPMSHRSSYYSAWCPLDSATVENGTLAFPLGTSIIELQLGDKVNSDGKFFLAKFHTENADEVKEVLNSDTVQSSSPEPSESDNGILLTVDPGTIVLFSSTTWHMSGDNRSFLPRRVLYVQYSPTVITSSSSSCRKDSNSSHVDTVTGHNREDYPLSFGVPCCIENSTTLFHSEKTNTSGMFPNNVSGDAIQSLLQSTQKSATYDSCKRTRFV